MLRVVLVKEPPLNADSTITCILSLLFAPAQLALPHEEIPPGVTQHAYVVVPVIASGTEKVAISLPVPEAPSQCESDPEVGVTAPG